MEQTSIPSGKALLSHAWQIYKRHFKLFLQISVVPTVALVVIIPFVLVAMLTGGVNGTYFSVLVAVFIVLLLLAVYLGMWSQVALIKAIEMSHHQIPELSFKEVFKRSRSKIWVFLGASILAMLAVLGGFILLIVPGIIFALWYSLSSYVVVCEPTSAAGALRVSKAYVRGRSKMVLGRWVVMGLTYLGVSVALQAVFWVLGFSGDTASTVRNIIMSLFMAPFASVYGYLLYTALKNHPLAQKQVNQENHVS